MANSIDTLKSVMGANLPGMRCFEVPDDRLISKFRCGDIAVVDTTNLSLAEGYVLLDCGDFAQAYRLQISGEGGFLLHTDNERLPPIRLNRERLEAGILGRIVGAMVRV